MDVKNTAYCQATGSGTGIRDGDGKWEIRKEIERVPQVPGDDAV